MRRFKLDRIDRQILRDLQTDGRMTNVELAQRVGISAPPCLRRVRALEAAGYIKGYEALLDLDALGFGYTVFARVGLKSQAAEDLRKFDELVRSWPEVREAHQLQGEDDFLLKIVTFDPHSFQEFLETKLTPAPNVSRVKTANVQRVSKAAPRVPVELLESSR